NSYLAIVQNNRFIYLYISHWICLFLAIVKNNSFYSNLSGLNFALTCKYHLKIFPFCIFLILFFISSIT
ncbi:hypothetical protein PPACK8108_LOCUS3435, partial [Phakopsora pachyrhizi]